MDNKTYDRLKYVVQIILPAIATFIGVIGSEVQWPATQLTLTIMAAAIALLGTVLGVSSYNYKNTVN